MELKVCWISVTCALALVLKIEVVSCEQNGLGLYRGANRVLDLDMEEDDDGENYGVNNDLFDWDPAGQTEILRNAWSPIGALSSVTASSMDPMSRIRIASHPGYFKTKRSYLGLLGLATKRPHKTAADVQYRPNEDAFHPVRGRKRSLLLPLQSTSYFLRTIQPNNPYHYGVRLGFRSRRSLKR